MWDGRYWWTATTSIARKKGGSLILQTHLIISHLIRYIHWLSRTNMTFREKSSYRSTERRRGAGGGGGIQRNERAVHFRLDEKTVCTQPRAVVPNDWFLLPMSLLFTFTTGANFGPSLGSKRSLSRIAESRDARPTESTLKTHRMSRRSLNKINMAAINV